MNPITSLLASTDWWYVLVCVIMSMLIGMIWFHDSVFGVQYRKWMKIHRDAKKPGVKEMIPQFGGEIISRFLYFLGIGQIFQVTGWESVGNGLILAVVVYAIFVFPTQLSQVSWSPIDKRILRLLVGKGLLETLIATVLRYRVF